VIADPEAAATRGSFRPLPLLWVSYRLPLGRRTYLARGIFAPRDRRSENRSAPGHYGARRESRSRPRVPQLPLCRIWVGSGDRIASLRWWR